MVSIRMIMRSCRRSRTSRCRTRARKAFRIRQLQLHNNRKETMRKTSILFIACAMLLAGAARAQSVYSDTYVIPIAGHATCAFGSVYMTDVSITNFNNDPLTVQIIVVQQGENTTDNVFP